MKINYIFVAILSVCFYLVINLIWPNCSVIFKINETFGYLVATFLVWIIFKKSGGFWGSVIGFFVVSTLIWTTLSGVGVSDHGFFICRNIFTS